MNALQIGIFQKASGLLSPYVSDFIGEWSIRGDADDAMAALASATAHGVRRVAEWAARSAVAARAAGAGDDLVGEFEMLAEAAREAERIAKG